jgi:hypothetical protein
MVIEAELQIPLSGGGLLCSGMDGLLCSGMVAYFAPEYSLYFNTAIYKIINR